MIDDGKGLVALGNQATIDRVHPLNLLVDQSGHILRFGPGFGLSAAGETTRLDEVVAIEELDGDYSFEALTKLLGRSFQADLGTTLPHSSGFVLATSVPGRLLVVLDPVRVERGTIELRGLGLETDLIPTSHFQEVLLEQLESSLRETRDLNRRMEAEREACESKTRFFAQMNHEIRTPLNAILGMMQLGLNGDSLSEVEEYVREALSAAEGMLEVLNGLLDFSSLESGSIELERRPIRLRETMSSAFRTFQASTELKGLEYTLTFSDAVPAFAIGDGLRLRQILLNLIGNAIKFTDRGRISVDVGVTSGAGQMLELLVRVSDTGKGIPRESQQVIFDAFAQADASTCRTHGGNGLGLAISSELVKLMGGTIWAESDGESGSLFGFTVQLERMQPVAEGQRNLKIANESSHLTQAGHLDNDHIVNVPVSGNAAAN